MKKVLVLALTVLAVPALAADGDLDLNFGIGGRVTTDFAGARDWAVALALQSDGKIVAAGGTGRGLSTSTTDFAISRYNSDGSLDATFGFGGKVTTDFSGLDDSVYALAIQSDGRIVAAGVANYGNRPTVRPIPPELQGSGSDDFGLVRYNTDGSLDITFGNGGKVTTDFSGRVDWAYALAIQSDGKIVVAGAAYVDGLVRDDFALARYNRDGSPDTTFGTNGRVTTDLCGSTDRARTLVLQSDGKIVVAGEVYLSNPPVSALARYNSDGSLDLTFGVAGKILKRHGTSVGALAIQSDGKIVAAGWAVLPDDWFGKFGLARYNQDGSPDTTFGNGGEVVTDPSDDGLSGVATTVAILPDEKILLVGEAYVGDFGFGLVRYNPDGSLDTTFGTKGIVTTKFASSASASASAIQSDGKIIAAGSTGGPGFSDFALARYNNDLLLATGIQFDRASVRVGDLFTATFSGTNLSDQTYFDVRFHSPGSATDQVALNWQRGTSATHNVPSGTATGIWSVTGIRAHKDIGDHNGGFVSVSATVTVSSF